MLNTPWKDWCCSWSSKTLDMWWKELPHFKRLWCWERLRAKKRRRQQRRRWLDSITVDGHEFEQTAGDCEEQKDQCAAVNGLTVKCDLAPEQHLGKSHGNLVNKQLWCWLTSTAVSHCIRSLEFSRIMEAADNIWYRGKSNITSDMSSISGVKKELDFPEAMTPALGLCQHCLCRKSSLISSQMGLFD